MNYRDEFSDPQRSGILGILDAIGPKAGFFAVLIALSFLVGVVWNLYSSDGGTKGTDVPIIRADNKPFKAIPDDPGGEEISHRDSTVFSTLRGGRGENVERIENLFDDEEGEEPLPRSQLFSGLNTEEDTASIEELSEEAPIEEKLETVVAEEPKEEKPVIDEEAEEIVQEALNALPTISVKPETKPIVAKPKPVEVKKAPVKAPAKVAPVKIPAPSEKIIADLNSVVEKAADNVPAKLSPTPMTSSAGDYYIQVGSVRGATNANGEWIKIQGKHSVLAGMSHRVEAVDLGSKGVFHRIQAGPVSKERADAICREIKKKTPGGCLVKKK